MLAKLDERLRRCIGPCPAFSTPSDIVLLLVLILVGAVFRLVVVDTLHVDEALYAYYGLHLVRTGDVLPLHVGFPIDKIPVFFWTVGATIGALGNTPIAIRLPDLAASLLTVACVYALAKDVCGRVGGWFAGLSRIRVSVEQDWSPLINGSTARSHGGGPASTFSSGLRSDLS